jgi:uncharacterized protein YyaL (SSP411 family)
MRKKIRRCFIAVIFLFFMTNQISIASQFRFSPRPNKAYLIEWRQWDKTALEEAKKKEKLILLSLSAVWCHWCHVMDETTYSDMDIIAFINMNFIPIRVDSDMRPDIDSLYNQGGWPSTVILTPEGDIVDGGTYIPPHDMKERLKRIIKLYAEQKDQIQERVQAIRKQLESLPKPERSSPDKIDMAKVAQIVEDVFDWKQGGFGQLQKFPNPDAIDFLLSEYFHLKKKRSRDMVSLTLDHMAGGEIYDDVEGGFFRYSTKPDWSVPHYEKMLIDNAGIIKNYAEAYMLLNEKSYEKIIKGSIDYVTKNLMNAETGQFYGSQDADEEYYKEKNRKGLTPPYIDKTTYTDSNARMISGLVSAYLATGIEDYIATAEKSAEFIAKNLYSSSNGAYHYYLKGKKKLKGILSDNVYAAAAFLDLYNATGNRKYLSMAINIGNLIVKYFYDEETKQFRPSLDTTWIRPVKAGMLMDFQTAIVNFRTSILLSRLYYIDKDDMFKKITDGILSSYKEIYDNFTPAVPLYGLAVRWHLKEPTEIIIIANRNKALRFLSETNKIYIPEKTVLVLSPDKDRDKISGIGYPADIEAVYICEGKRCSKPVKKAADIQRSIKKFLDI